MLCKIYVYFLCLVCSVLEYCLSGCARLLPPPPPQYSGFKAPRNPLAVSLGRTDERAEGDGEGVEGGCPPLISELEAEGAKGNGAVEIGLGID